MDERGQVDRQLRDLIEIIHFAEDVSAKIHGLLDEAEIYRTVREEFTKSERYDASLFLLTDDGSKLRIAETSLMPGMVNAGEKLTGLRLKEYRIDLSKVGIFNPVVREGKTVQVDVREIIGALLPRPLAYLISRILGYEKKRGILTPLSLHGKIIGAFAMSSAGLEEYFIPSVRSLAQHISTALEMADERTERKKAEEALRESEERLQSIFSTMTDGITLVGLDGKNLDCNDAVLRLHGVSRDEYLGRSVYDFIASDDRERAIQEAPVVLERGYIRSEVKALRGKGGAFDAEINVSLLRDASGEPMAFLGVTRDITERKKAEDALQESEEWHHAVFEGSRDPIFITGADSRFVNVKEAAEILTGYSKEELKGMGIPDLHDVPDLHAYESFFSRIMAGEPITSEAEILRKDGIKVPTEFSNRRIVIRGVPYMHTAARDITERKQAEQKLLEYADHLEEMVEERTRELQKAKTFAESIVTSAMDGIAVAQLDGTLIRYNETFLRMLGYSGEELKNVNFRQTTSEKRWTEDETRYEKLMQGTPSVNYETELVRKDDLTFPVTLSISLLTDEEGKPTAMMAIVRDETERKKMEARLLNSERMAAIGEVAAMVGHDLRNPMQVIVNTLYLSKEKLKSMPITERKIMERYGFTELRGVLLEQVEYMNKIVFDLQDYARPVKSELVETSLHRLIDGILSTMTIPENVKVSIAIEEGFPKLMVDPALMRRVLTNLVTNALQAMLDGGLLTIRASKTAETASISIQDKGVGIPEENLPKLFQPLFTTKARGQGFGLPVCQRLVEAHGGTITVESQVGKGSTFTVQIPLKKR